MTLALTFYNLKNVFHVDAIHRARIIFKNLRSPLEPADVPLFEVELLSSVEARGANGAASVLDDGRGPYVRAIFPGCDKKLSQSSPGLWPRGARDPQCYVCDFDF